MVSIPCGAPTWRNFGGAEMDLLGSQNAFAELVREALSDNGFVLIDVGAANGVATAWRSFGSKLRGFGFDPDVDEVARLNAIEPAPAFQYIAASLGLRSGGAGAS